ncbi:MAG: hypothetical protein E6Q68_09770 [Polynucleobacter sp.]|nr:MAG: hypothetical protein E6Q68_09770 [Polynucleobacter sp.]
MAETNEQQNSKQSKTSKADSTVKADVPAICEMMGDTDIVLQVDIRMYDKNGEVFKVKGLNTLPHIIDPSLLPESYRNFEETYHASISRPVLASFRKFISKHIQREESSTPFTLPSSSENTGYLSDPGGA